MSATVVKLQGIGKKYRIHHQRQQRYATLRDTIAEKMRSAFRADREAEARNTVEDFWALKDISFEIKRGEVVGIIGRNGAGKSTLLKILSRITEPTTGRLEIEGRVASLLEVGTGFHPELSGRENIYLNGAVMGMTRSEITRKFDEMVAFAEVEKFLDTPVKRYSSGMYVRLAFAVAAHLDPEILIVDEVLAVGDAEFQKKSLGKMQDVASKSGRTVLFVSHNMESVLKLCSRVILIADGRRVSDGDVSKVVSAYLEDKPSFQKTVDLQKMPRTIHCLGHLRLVQLRSAGEHNNWSFPFGQEIGLDIWVETSKPADNIELGMGLFSARGFEVASWNNNCARTKLHVVSGRNLFHVRYQDLRLLPGQYHFGIVLRSERGIEDYVAEAVRFEVIPSAASAFINAQEYGGAVVPTATVSIGHNVHS